MRVRLQAATGQFILTDIQEDTSMQEFLQICMEKSKIPLNQLVLVNTSQIPHTPVKVINYEKSVHESGIRNGDSLRVEQSQQGTVEDQPNEENNSGKNFKHYVQMKDGDFLLKRQIASDNSCLFNAVAYVMGKNKHSAKKLRQIIVEQVSQNPDFYNETFLEKTNKAYCDWILNDSTWGGAIELSILSKFYNKKIAAFDIRSKRCDVYGEDKDYKEVGVVIYDGLHYDALALSPSLDNSLQEFDTTLFQTESQQLTQVLQAASELVKQYNEAHQYTNTQNFTLRCVMCMQGLKGEDEAKQHAEKTGHINFQEYR